MELFTGFVHRPPGDRVRTRARAAHDDIHAAVRVVHRRGRGMAPPFYAHLFEQNVILRYDFASDERVVAALRGPPSEPRDRRCNARIR